MKSGRVCSVEIGVCPACGGADIDVSYAHVFNPVGRIKCTGCGKTVDAKLEGDMSGMDLNNVLAKYWNSLRGG